MITVSDVSLHFADRKLFDDVNINFTPGNCYGLIGANGAGKSTFLKVLAGDIKPSTGNVSMGTNERLATLKQNHFDYDDYTVMETVIMGHSDLYRIMQEKDALYAKPDFNEEDGTKAAELETEFGEKGGWEAEGEASQMLQGLNIPESLHQEKMSNLTAGQKIKVLLAQALFGQPDVLLLDEPTNGLDVDSIDWLEDFLINFENTVIVVSHDRYFLNKVCTYMADLDYGKIKLYAGNYDFWLKSSELAQKMMQDQNAKKEEKIKELQEFIARFSANASKSKQATSRKKMLDKITLDDIQPSSRRYPFIKFVPNREIGNDLLQVKDLNLTIDGKKILNNVSFILNKDDKVAFLAKNDMVTTALFKVITGELTPDSGTITWGVTTSRAYLPKDFSSMFDEETPIIDWLRQFAEKGEDDDTFLRGFLGRMLFSGTDVTKMVNVLSGGEKVRVMLSKMMLLKANVLLMDDPTNHLDLESITALNDGLIDYKGSILFASHDHQFIQTIANRLIYITENGIVDRADTTYDEFRNNKQVESQIAELEK
ncbi:ABC-F family ATP-binding cassette domain-containing protein [Companilactobacillus sp.]|uniref:ABC-F family ATP-binding cassette domain-containing protein n=1 Tax=Companilactobacillus sp. TaxID=2767905 RepID=UPI0025C41C7C|nr:ATP-binding cassette domain-containing protein [Companilactobacillus sp.]MCH4008181.1 ATP-binding cassette domain-containing protein [Companilactobacillus sp.]MCH4051640.1 ATP-binding cassette domain-containing protein [Companilactobacillus sp.]MCH4076124.1 ATP-binding cassette domain-containing protein [Companilactobacillus sp.]MCH4124699.1 ATP-binding cassette domain-containing protein [Companilactobacillus sp.]MCH4131241.1 ATP-binding cassette domain-containing protein [Companilactobacil